MQGPPPAGRRDVDVLVAAGLALLCLVAGTAAVGSLRLLAGLEPGAAPLPVASVGVTAGLAWWARRRDRRAWVPCWLVLAGAVATAAAASIAVAGLVPDTTYDGQWYHQEAVLQLVEGWNPVAAELGSAELPDPEQRSRVNGYPAASWIAGAAAVALTGRLDHAAWTTAALGIAAWWLAWAAVAGGLGVGRLRAAALSAVMAANPVVVVQLLNTQLDGDLASCLLVLAVTPWLRTATPSRLVPAAAGAAVAMAVGVKLSGGLFAGVLVAGAVLARRRPDGAVAAAAAAGLLGGVLLVGFHPYVTNLARHGHPLYPVLGPDARPILETPEIGRVEGLLASAFSRSRHPPTSAEAVASLLRREGLKPPLAVAGEEIAAFAVPDVRIGGFGPLFGLGLLAALAALVAVGRSGGLLLWGPVATIVASVLVFPHPWFARLVPQLWLVPAMAAAAAIASRRPAARLLGAAVVVACVADLGLVLVGHVPNAFRHGRAVEARLRELSSRPAPLEVDLRPFLSNRARLERLGIAHRQVDDPGRSLQTVLGTWLPSARSADAVEGGVRLDWVRVRGASRYRLEAWRGWPATAAEAAEALREVPDPPATVEVPPAAAAVTVRACNELGCGPAVVVWRP